MKIAEFETSRIKDSEYNPRKISPADYKELYKSIEKFGLVDPLIVNVNKKRELVLIGGHQRLKICKKLKIKKVSCVCLDLSLKLEKELNIRLNKNQGEFDFELLEKHFTTETLIDFGFSPFQFADVTFIDDLNSIQVEHSSDNLKSKDEAVMLEIPMSPEQKKEIMITLNQYKQNRDISNGVAMYEIICVNNVLA